MECCGYEGSSLLASEERKTRTSVMLWIFTGRVNCQRMATETDMRGGVITIQ
jgi:hypothetical protein